MLFKGTKILIGQIDEFLDTISQSGLLFSEMVRDYLEGNHDIFTQRLETMRKLEGRADELRRNIENQLYTHSLIPEHRGDVLGLLETLDDVIDNAKEAIFLFEVETPEIPPELHGAYKDLAHNATQAVEAIVNSTRAFFRDPKSVKDHIHKVFFFEHEADKISYQLKKRIFQDLNLDLSRKFHLRYFIQQIDSIADNSEKVADRLTIYVIKQTN